MSPRVSARGNRATQETALPALQRMQPMLPTRARPFSDPAWLFEFKLDGYRILALKSDDHIELRTRQGHEVSGWFPELCEALTHFKGDLALDGEVCALDEKGKPDFHALAAHRTSRRPRGLRPAVFFAFDLLWFKQDLRRLPIEKRKKCLQELLRKKPSPLIQYVPYAYGQGLQLLAGAAAQGLEGVVAKRAGSAYAGGRTRQWLKFIVPGYRRPKKERH